MNQRTSPFSILARSLPAVALFGALVFLCPGSVSGKEPDFEAVAKRLIESVKAGELAPEQAAAMMAELARTSFLQRLQGTLGDRSAGKSLQDRFLEEGIGGETFAAIRKHLANTGLGGGGLERVLEFMLRLAQTSKKGTVAIDQKRLDRFAQELGLGPEQLGRILELAKGLAGALRDREKILAALRAGELSREEAAKKLEAVGRGLFSGQKRGAGPGQAKKPGSEELARVKEKLRAGVKEGKLTEEQAKEHLEAYLKKAGKPEPKGHSPEDLAQAVAKLRKAVAEGKLSEEEARGKMEGLRKALAEQGGRKELRRETGEALETLGRRLRQAVEEGKMTREEARERMEEAQKRLAGGAKQQERRKGKTGPKKPGPGRVEPAQVKEKLWAGVKAGKLTEEQAEEKWRAYLKGLREKEAKGDRRGAGAERRF